MPRHGLRSACHELGNRPEIHVIQMALASKHRVDMAHSGNWSLVLDSLTSTTNIFLCPATNN